MIRIPIMESKSNFRKFKLVRRERVNHLRRIWEKSKVCEPDKSQRLAKVRICSSWVVVIQSFPFPPASFQNLQNYLPSSSISSKDNHNLGFINHKFDITWVKKDIQKPNCPNQTEFSATCPRCSTIEWASRARRAQIKWVCLVGLGLSDAPDSPAYLDDRFFRSPGRAI